MIESDLVTPFRYSVINSQLHRGSYPTLVHFRFLYHLKIKTIISLVPEKPSPDLQRFCDVLGIELVHFQIQRIAPINPVLHQQLIKALNICINPDNFPIYMHCLDGRRITSLLVLLLRRLQQYSVQWAFSEFWKFQMIGRAIIPMQDMERASREIEKYMSTFDSSELIVPNTLPKWLCGSSRTLLLAGLKGSSNTSKSVAGNGQVTSASGLETSTIPIVRTPSLPSSTTPASITLKLLGTRDILSTPSKVITGLALHGLDLPSSKSTKKRGSVSTKPKK